MRQKHIILFSNGLGNQLFYYAFYKKLATKHRHIYITYHPDINKMHSGYELERIFNLKFKKIPDLFRRFLFSNKPALIKLRQFFSRFIPIHSYNYLPEFGTYFPLANDKSGIYTYEGYWQSEKYFQDIKKEIRANLQFPPLSEKENLSLIEKTSSRTRISLHVRRGDYISYGFVFPDSAVKNYYQNAMEYMCKKIENPIFLIFSNDIPWCKKHICPPPAYQSVFVDWNTGQSSFRDMQLMSLCQHNIIANSSFSWWGAWLNPNPHKIVIAPKTWFKDSPREYYKDIIPKDWIQMKND